MIRFHPSFALLLAALLVFTAHSMQMARGSASVAGQIVICSGTGPLTVSVDVNGQPVGHSHICPYCALFQGGVPDSPALGLLPPDGSGDVDWVQGALIAADARRIPVHARGPPLSGAV